MPFDDTTFNPTNPTVSVSSNNTNMLGLLSAGSNLAGSIVNGIVTAQQNKKARQFEQQQTNLKYQRDLEQWNRSNEYNTPSAQMARYEAAGLNKNLIYGQGTPGNTATSTPSYQTVSAKFGIPQIHGFDLINAYQDFRSRQEDIKYKTAAAYDMQNRANISNISQYLKPYEFEYLTGENWAYRDKTKQGLYDYNLDAKNLSLREKENNINRIIADVENKKAQTKLTTEKGFWASTKNRFFGETNTNIDKDSYLERLITDAFGVTIEKLLKGTKLAQQTILNP